jgi:hypothetical protein
VESLGVHLHPLKSQPLVQDAIIASRLMRIDGTELLRPQVAEDTQAAVRNDDNGARRCCDTAPIHRSVLRTVKVIVPAHYEEHDRKERRARRRTSRRYRGPYVQVEAVFAARLRFGGSRG